MKLPYILSFYVDYIINKTTVNLIILREIYKVRLNMFLVPIKLRSFKFSPYLILIAFLIPINDEILHITLLIFLTIERTQIPQSSKKLAKFFLCVHS